MTDGPYKNAALTERWKKFGNALDNDAMSRDERTQRAERALSKDLSQEFRALVQELNCYVTKPQLDLQPRVMVQEIFDKHPRSPLADTLQRFFSANLARPMTIETAFSLALDSTIRKEQHNIRNRMIEETMYARDRGDLAPGRYPTIIERLGEVAINVSRMCDDVLTNKTAPRAALAKMAGLDDGPSI